MRHRSFCPGCDPENLQHRQIGRGWPAQPLRVRTRDRAPLPAPQIQHRLRRRCTTPDQARRARKQAKPSSAKPDAPGVEGPQGGPLHRHGGAFDQRRSSGDRSPTLRAGACCLRCVKHVLPVEVAGGRLPFWTRLFPTHSPARQGAGYRFAHVLARSLRCAPGMRPLCVPLCPAGQVSFCVRRLHNGRFFQPPTRTPP